MAGRGRGANDGRRLRQCGVRLSEKGLTEAGVEYWGWGREWVERTYDNPFYATFEKMHVLRDLS